MVLDKSSLKVLTEALEELETGFQKLPKFEPLTDQSALGKVLLEVAERMKNNYPYAHPLYAGQMLKPPHPIARLAYTLALWINPNNHALDAGPASSMMEKEAVGEIANMFGWPTYLGHLCGGGTMANLEALWVAGNLQKNSTIVASKQAHYTHQRICGVLRLPFQEVPCDSRGKMDIDALKAILETGEVGTVVVTMGTTATGSVDPLPEILELQTQYNFRIHADAAYGGYFTLAENLDPETRLIFDCLQQVDSIAIDPHKHGLQPYGCGCILFQEPSVGTLYKHDSPYTYFSSSELHLGEISLECSRAGASAVALWATQRLFPLTPGGEFAANLSSCRKAALMLYEKVQQASQYRVTFVPELDIVVWSPSAESASQMSELSEAIFKEAAHLNLHLALADLPKELLAEVWPEVEWDRDHVTCLRSCLMKPEHADWIEEIWQLIEQATRKVFAAYGIDIQG